MNLRWILIALIFSALPFIHARAESDTSLDKSDFVRAEIVMRNGQTLIDFQLSRLGQAKVHELNQTKLDHPIRLTLAGKAYRFVLRQAILADRLEAGPFAQAEAREILRIFRGT